MTKLSNISREQAIDALIRNEFSSDPDYKARVLANLHSEFSQDDGSSLKVTYSWSQEAESLVADSEPSSVYQKIIDSTFVDEFKSGQFPNVLDNKYDEILVECLKENFIFRDNEELRDELQEIGVDVGEVTGTLKLFACPCCGADTLPERQSWDICPVCRWEDDGTDNIKSSLYYSGPNKGLQLTEARIFYLLTGISNPSKTHDKGNEELIKNFDRSRYFEIDKEKGIIFEKGTDWYAPLAPPHLKEGETKPKVSLAGSGLRDWPPNVK